MLVIVVLYSEFLLSYDNSQQPRSKTGSFLTLGQPPLSYHPYIRGFLHRVCFLSFHFIWFFSSFSFYLFFHGPLGLVLLLFLLEFFLYCPVICVTLLGISIIRIHLFQIYVFIRVVVIFFLFTSWKGV